MVASGVYSDDYDEDMILHIVVLLCMLAKVIFEVSVTFPNDIL